MDLLKISNSINILAMVVVLASIWTFVISDNATYTATNLLNEQMSAVGNRIIIALSNNDEINDDTPIYIGGQLDFSIHNPRLLELTNFDVSNINLWTWQIFLEEKLGLGRSIYTLDINTDIWESEDYLNMPVFPDEGSIKVIDGIAVVKLSY